MQPGAITLLRSKGLALVVHAAFWLLLVLIVARFGGKAPDYQETSSYSLPTLTPVPVQRMDALFSPKDWPTHVLQTNMPSPFFTAAFLPVPKPAPAPPPPPPTTRKVTLVYQGFFETADAGRKAMIKTSGGFTSTSLGAPVITNYFIAEISIRALTLTNSAGQTNVLQLNTPAELEIPIK